MASVAPIRIVGNIEIPTETEKFVGCTIEANLTLHSKAFVTEDSSYAFSDKDLFLTPAIVKPVNGAIFLLIANPTNEPKFLFSSMCIAYGYVWEECDGLLKTPDLSAINTVLDDRDLTPDTSFRINLSECLVSSYEVRKLKQLSEEYSDVFSYNEFDLRSCTAIKHDSYHYGLTGNSEPAKVAFQ